MPGMGGIKVGGTINLRRKCDTVEVFTVGGGEGTYWSHKGKNRDIGYEEQCLTISYLGIRMGWCCLVWGGSVDGANCACQR